MFSAFKEISRLSNLCSGYYVGEIAGVVLQWYVYYLYTPLEHSHCHTRHSVYTMHYTEISIIRKFYNLT